MWSDCIIGSGERWIAYLRAIKRQFRDFYGFQPNAQSTEDDPWFDHIPDGEYPMTIDGEPDQVRVRNGWVTCFRF